MIKAIRQAQLEPSSSVAKLSQACSQNLLSRLKLERQLEGHQGCTNTVSFNPAGDILLSGSDDLTIRLWSWQSGRQLLKISPGHHNNIFQAHVLPHTNDSTIVSCAADGQVRVTTLDGSSRSSSTKVGSHAGRAHKLSLLPENPACTFLSTGEDGMVMKYDLRARPSGPVSKLKVLEEAGPSVELNAVHANPCRPWLFAVGGGDPYARIFDVRLMKQDMTVNRLKPVAKLCPNHLREFSAEPVHITCVQYNRCGELLATYNDEDIYLFDAASAEGQERPVASTTSGLDSPDRDNADDAEVEEDAERQSVDDSERRAAGARATSSTSPHPASSPSLQGGGIRLQRPHAPQQDFVLQRFKGHRNSQTVKGVSFYGASDEYVISGSDCGHIFFWSKKDGELLRLMKGDDWVVNCLTPHPWQPLLLATSGIENSVKIWSPTAEEMQPQDKEYRNQVVEENKARRQRSARRLVVPPHLLLALLTGRRAERARARERRAEENDEEGGSQSSEEEGQELAEGVMMARLRRLLLQRASVGDFSGLGNEASSSQEEDDDDEDEEDEDDHGLPNWGRLSNSQSGGSDEGSSGNDSDSSNGGRSGSEGGGGASSSGSSGSEAGDRAQCSSHEEASADECDSGGDRRRGGIEESSRGGKRAKPNDD